jgi:hypothetical protein
MDIKQVSALEAELQTLEGRFEVWRKARESHCRGQAKPCTICRAMNHQIACLWSTLKMADLHNDNSWLATAGEFMKEARTLAEHHKM